MVCVSTRTQATCWTCDDHNDRSLPSYLHRVTHLEVFQIVNDAREDRIFSRHYGDVGHGLSEGGRHEEGS